MATILDVAKLAGVSPSTARRAVMEPQRVAPITLERVQKAIKQLDYEVDHTAGALRRGRSLSIGLIVGDILEPHFSKLIRVIGQRAREHGYTLLVAENEYQASVELKNLKMFNGHRISGLIVRPGYGDVDRSYLQRMKARGTAILEIDYVSSNSPFSSIMLDNEASIKSAVRYLYDLGHRRIAAVGRQYKSDLEEDRIHYFLEAMQKRGLSVPSHYDVYAPTESEAYEATHRLMRLAKPPTALLCVTGTCGEGTFRALEEVKLSIPNDVSLLTFDNDSWTSLVTPKIDVIEQPVDEMGAGAIKYILEEIENPSEVVIKRRYPGKLITRGSCGPNLRGD